mgnify:CR=1 FL=1
MNKFFGVITVSVFVLTSLASAQSLKVGNFSIKANGETEMISVKKDGNIEVNSVSIGVLQKDGKLKDTNGKTIAEIDKTGKVTANGKPLGIVNKNGEYDNGSGKKIGWTQGGKFNVSESKFVTISPNNKKLYQTATFLIFLYLFADQVKTESPTVSLADEKLMEKFRYQDSDLVASIAKSPGRGGFENRGYSIKLYGDGRITHAGETINAKRVPSNKKEIQVKINRFLQKAEELKFLEIFEQYSKTPIPFVHDGITFSIGVRINGIYRQIDLGGDVSFPSMSQLKNRVFC